MARVAEVASYIPGPIGAAAAGVSSVAYAATGNWRKAGEMAVTAVAGLVGANTAVKAAFRVVKASAKVVPKATSRVAKATRSLGRSCRNSFTPESLLANGSGGF